MLPVRTILHPTDFSEAADYAYRLARVVARDCGARLIVLHIAGVHVDVSPVVYTEMGAPFILPGDYQGYHAALRDQLRERSDPSGDFLKDHESKKAQLHDRFNGGHKISVETRLEHGDAAEEILRVAEEVGCDLIVMGTHGRSGLGRLLMGSVAEAVLRRARCPVLTVKSPAAVPSSGSGEPTREAATA
jgi:nucleotide-binding universal stress UspA family protein